MRKRIIALLLALILTVGLLPTVALATEGNPPTTDSGSVTKEANKDNLNLVKTVTKEGDNYKVTLESWATGTVTTTTKTKPLDIVLLLDVSGSMDDKYSDAKIDKYVPYDYNWYGGPLLGGYNTTNSDLYEYQSTRYGVWYKIPNSETYVSVKVEKEWKLFADDDYTYSYEQNGSTIIIEKTSNGNKPPKTQFYYKESADTTKLDALKTAVSAFIDNVATNSPNSKISIVKFANDRYKSTEGNDTFRQDGYEYNYTQIVKKLTKVDTNGVTALKKAIGELKAGGATASDYGLNKAQEALEGAKQERVVILFTDGEPNHSRDFDKKVATDAVNKAKELKTAETKTTIYTVGVFKDPSNDVNLYMSSVSSNYPNASATFTEGKPSNWTVTDGGSDFGKYYMNATSPVDLLKAFETISSEVSGGELGAEAVLTDVIAPNFALVAPEGTTGVTAYTVDKTADGWSTQKTTLTNGVTVGTDGQVNVTGFDYSENCVTTTAKPNTTSDYGKKLVVEFTIHHNNYGGTQPTNAGAGIKDKENKDVITVDNPTVPVTISKPDDIFASAIEKPYDGTGFDILDKVAEKAKILANGTNNKFVNIEVKVTVGNTDYIYKIPAGQTTGTWNQAGTPKTSPDVKATTLGTAENYEYPVTITFKDAAQGSTASNSTATNAKFKINYAKVTVTANDESKKTTEPDPTFNATVSGMVNGEKAEDKLNYTISRTDATDNTVGDHNTITPAGDTYQNNYEVTYETGTLTIMKGDPTATEFSLTGKFQKTLNSNTADVPAAGKEFTLTIEKGEDVVASGKAEFTTLTDNNGTYTDTKSFFGANDKLTFNKEGTYTYTVQEVNPTAPVAGMKYDETIYTLTIEVTESNGALSITSAKVTKPGAADQPELVADLLATTHDSFTITNTFTAATLPLDLPPEDEDPESLTAGIKVFKSLTGDRKTETFTAKIYDGQTEKATATAYATTGTPAAFDGFGTLVFTEAKTYNYTIKEIPGSTAGMKYDERFPNGHTMNITVEAEDNKLVVKTVTIDGTKINLADDAWLTITNTYTEPKEPRVVSKTVVTNLLTLSIPMQNGIHEFESRKGITILYPVANNGTNTLEVTKGTTTAWLLYKISVDAGTQQSLWFDDANVDNFWYKVDEVAVSRAGSRFKVEFKNNVRTADIYVTVNHALNFNNKGECTVENAIGEIKATTTVTEKDPDKLTINFADYVQKELAATGTKTASDVDFTVDVKGKEQTTIITSAEGEEAISTYADEFDPKYSRTLTAHFDSITGGETKTTPFTGSVEITSAGQYIFELREEDGQRTGVTYDETIYTLHVLVEEKEGSLAVTHWYFTDSNRVEHNAGEKAAFHNTIDTGKDDYYPIIIPTIINKDTGMLNKTDHFAYVIGYPDGTVHPNGQITRAEVATIFFRLLRDEVRDGAFTTSNTYSDVAYGKWYNNPISTMSALGIITGYPDGTFKPNKPITRAEFAAIAARFDETQSGKSATFSDVIGHWAAKEIGIAYYNDWIKGYPDGTFKPDQNITRAEAMTLINRVLERKPESPADLLTNMNKWTDNMDTSKWYYLDVQEATNSHGYTRKTFNYELWRQMLNDPDWSRYER